MKDFYVWGRSNEVDLVNAHVVFGYDLIASVKLRSC